MFRPMALHLMIPRAHCVRSTSLSLKSTQKVDMSASVFLIMHPPIPHSTNVKLIHPFVLMALEINKILIVSGINKKSLNLT